MSTQYKQLYRSRNNRMIAGVCGGLGEYFNIDPTLVRLLFVLGTIFGLGSLLIIYIVLMVVVPEEPTGTSPVTPPPAGESSYTSVTPPPAGPETAVDVEPADTDTL